MNNSLDASIVQTIKFDVFIPSDPAHCFESIETITTRNWVVPGENLCFFVRTSPSIIQLESLSFSAFVVLKPMRSRKSTIIPSMLSFQVNNFLDPKETIAHKKFSLSKPFRLENGYGIYPMSLHIPISIAVPFYLDVYIPRKTTPIVRHELKPVLPFNILFDRFSTSVSLVTQFTINCSIHSSSIKQVNIESTSLTFDARPPYNDIDYHSNVEILPAYDKQLTMKNDDSVTSVFSLRPLTELGACYLTCINIDFAIKWSVNELEFTTHFEANSNSNSLGLVIMMPPIKAKLMTATTIPVRITNVCNNDPINEICFDSGAIQPIAERIPIPIIEPGKSTTVDISLLPLVPGMQEIKYWAQVEGQRIDPMFPTYLYVE